MNNVERSGTKVFVSYYWHHSQGQLTEHISPLLHLLKRQSLGLGVIALISKMVINKIKIKFMIDSLINNSHFTLIKNTVWLSVCLSGPITLNL